MIGLAEEVGSDDKDNHEERHDEEEDLQPLVGLATELDGLETFALKARSIIVVMTMMMMMLLFRHVISRLSTSVKRGR